MSELRIITKDELTEIIRKHELWLANEDGSEFANLSEANLRGAALRRANLSEANLQLVGQDIRGYLFWSFANQDGVVVLCAGCRYFLGIAAARDHWMSRHIENVVLHANCLSLVDRCEQMAKVRGWKLEPTVE